MLHSWVLVLHALFAGVCRAAEPPHSILQLTIDQLRGDLIPRFRDEFGPNGFRRLLDHGTYYANAHYDTGNTFTAAGHAVLLTGADTAEHGMVANEWFDRETCKQTYCTFDPRCPTLGEPQKPGSGMSPANLTSTTVGDELVLASSRQSRAFAVGGKDRSAIIPAGHLGKAFWFSDSTGRFVSSTYYEALPDWVTAWNDEKHHDPYRSLECKSVRDPSSYKNVSAQGNPYAAFLSALRVSPFLDELTATFARELITKERLGRA